MGLWSTLIKKEGFTEREASISDFILDNPEKIADMSSRELGEYTFTSSTVIVRFCQKLGYKGYNDFKINLLCEINKDDFETLGEEFKISSGDNILSIIKKLSYIEKEVIDVTKSKISYNQMSRISGYLSEAKYIDFFAMDMNEGIAKYACHNLFFCGKVANNYTYTNEQHLLALNAGEDHLAIFISHTGENSRLVEAAKAMKRAKIKTIAITVDKERSLAKICDEYVEAVFIERFENVGNLMFSTSVKYILDMIFCLAFAKQYDMVLNLNDAYDKCGREKLWNLARKV
ncbi:SIS domain-containing protein [Clostridium neonatale]|uniref:MurR/RpiR family transcriptional regulator n=1 Tax=Clostridium neonatale TaxID=137838 RepID=UPI00291BE431|nr:MurR/RpiR family transcriptional regulator [Clostridium neonatale]CAI3248793.1 SIS domain-containing protein [Clostridium neonatale]